MLEIIYCAAGNRRFAEIAIASGMHYGAQLPNTHYFPPHFVDQNWKKPNRERYMAALAETRPHVSTVLDLERESQLAEVLGWAEDAAQYVQEVIIIPKVFGIIERLPRRIAGATVRLGFSVPTKFAGTEVPVWEFAGWPVHLLGGSPQKQMELCHYLDVVSADGNYAQKMALQYCQFWQPGTARYAVNRWWPKLEETNGGSRWNNDAKDAPYEAFERSCQAIMQAWQAQLAHP